MSPRYVFDTDTCVYWLKGDAAVERRVLETGLERIGIAVITLCELYYGAFKSDRTAANLEVVEGFAKKMTVLPAEPGAARLFGEIKARLEKSGQALDDADLLIGCIALARGSCLVTNNARHFRRIPDLVVETWARA